MSVIVINNATNVCKAMLSYSQWPYLILFTTNELEQTHTQAGTQLMLIVLWWRHCVFIKIARSYLFRSVEPWDGVIKLVIKQVRCSNTGVTHSPRSTFHWGILWKDVIVPISNPSLSRSTLIHCQSAVQTKWTITKLVTDAQGINEKWKQWSWNALK